MSLAACCSSRAPRCRSARTAIPGPGGGGRGRHRARRRERAALDRRRARVLGGAHGGAGLSCACWPDAKPICQRASWNALFLASRETAELRAETVQMGYSLTRLLDGAGHRATCRVRGAFVSRRVRARRARAGRSTPRRRADRLSLGLAGEPGDGGGEGGAARPDRRAADAARARRASAALQSAVTLDDDELGNFAPGLALLSRGTRRSIRGCSAHESSDRSSGGRCASASAARSARARRR